MSKILEHIQHLVNQVEQGEALALPAMIEIKQAEQALKEATAKIKDQAIDEASNYADREFKLQGAKIRKTSTPTRWDWSSVTQYKERKDEMKRLENLLQSARGSGQTTWINPEDGEVWNTPAKIEGQSTIAIQLDKPTITEF